MVAPLKPYEALMYGKIILSSSVDALTDIITHKYNGIIFEKNNLNDLVEKMKDIIINKYDLEKIQFNGYEYIQHKTWNNNLNDIYNLCNKIL
jgi:glycosyltransferase involved in cell wall biosynthesis